LNNVGSKTHISIKADDMKITLPFLLPILLLAGVWGCDSDSSAAGAAGDTITFIGTVAFQPIETGFYAIDADDGRQFEPLDLPPEFAVDGLRVRVTARVRDDMASVNMYGTLIEITEIDRL
jgi:hypothetical protein